MKSTGLALCAFLVLLRYGFAIMCYECNSATNSFCSAAILPASLQRNCSENDRGLQHTLCRKMIQHVDYEVNGNLPNSRVIRSCGWDDSKYKGVCYHRSGHGGRQEVCSCSSDLCNSSPKIPGSLGLILTSVTVYSAGIIQTKCIVF